MRRIAVSAVAGLAAAAVAVAVTPAGASAAPADTGLVFYATSPATPVLRVATGDGLCRSFPATASLLVGWSDVTTVSAYRTADCTGTETGLGTLSGFTPGTYRSFRAN